MVGHLFVRLQRPLSKYLAIRPLRQRWLGWLSGSLIVIVLIGFILKPVMGMQGAELVDIQAIAPHIQLDMRYATTNNFTNQKLYAQARCLLRPQVAVRLAAVQTDLEAQGLGLKVLDCYRPLSVQRRLWQLVPDPNYVADPKRGSRHNRASAVDLTLIDQNGNELPMPSNFDEFTSRSHLSYQGGNPATLQNRNRLQQAMKKRGFLPLATEWWHFDAPNWRSYSLLDVPLSIKTSAN